jgi:hypothetical protein
LDDERHREDSLSIPGTVPRVSSLPLPWKVLLSALLLAVVVWLTLPVEDDAKGVLRLVFFPALGLYNFWRLWRPDQRAASSKGTSASDDEQHSQPAPKPHGMQPRT